MSDNKDTNELIERFFKCTQCFEEYVIACVDCDIKQMHCQYCGAICEEIRD